jgi:parallel beta-helix repeat protein
MRNGFLILGLFAMLLCLPTVRSNRVEIKASNGYPVHNLNTGLNYTSIQSAIDAVETLDGQTILVDSRTYYEHVTVSKSLFLVGESRNTTIIDGSGTGPVVELAANNVSIANFTVRNGGNLWSPQYTGIRGNGLSNVLIENNTVTNVSNGIIFHDMHNSSMSHNFAQECGVMGLHFDSSSDCKMANNTVADSLQGIVVEKAVGNFIESNELKNDNLSINFYESADNLVEENSFMNSSVGILFDACNGSNNLRANNMTGNICNLIVWGSSIEAFLQNIDASNTVDNKAVYYITCSNNLLLNPSNCPNIGYLALVNCTNVTVKNIDPSDDEDGMLIAQSTNCSLVNVTLANARANITLGGFSSQPVIHGGLTFFNSDNNLMMDSTIMNTSVGVCLYQSSGNLFYHNSLVDIDEPVVSNFQGPGLAPSGPYSINKWDNDLEGNYWSNYAGIDSNQDGIGDSPCAIDANNTDRCPLMGMFSELPINWANRTYVATTICNSSISDLQFSVVYPHPPSQSWTTSITFNVSGDVSGFCRIMIPKDVLDGQYFVMLDGFSMPSSMWREMPMTNDTTLFLYMAYPAGSHEISIMGTTWVTEYPTELTFTLFTIATLLVAIAHGKTVTKKHRKGGSCGIPPLAKGANPTPH